MNEHFFHLNEEAPLFLILIIDSVAWYGIKIGFHRLVGTEL